MTKQYVIQCNHGSYYCGPIQDYVYKMGHWSNLLSTATVFSSLEEARDIVKNVKNVYGSNSFYIREYIPATVGSIVQSEKQDVINDLQEVVDRIDNTPYNYINVNGFKPSIEKALKFIEENVND